jgi:hypothetical protein
VDLDPQERDEWLQERVGQVRPPSFAAGAEHAVLVEPNDGPDHDALGAFEAGEGVVEVGGAEALLAEQGSGLRAARRAKAGSPVA